MKRKITVMILILLLAITARSVWAAGQPPESLVNYCRQEQYDEERCLTLFEGFTLLVTRWMTSLGVEMIRSIATGAWIVARLALMGFRLLVEGTWLETLRTALLSSLATFMPEALKNVALGPTGVMYVAMALAGILLTIPLAMGYGARLVRPDKVMVWGVVLVALFISGTAGYDLVGGLDRLRTEMMKIMLGQQTGSSVSVVVLGPMQATEEEADISLENLLSLPEGFETAYFVEVEETQVAVRGMEGGIATIFLTYVELSDSQARRRDGAVQALIFAILTVVGTGLLVIFLLGYLFLNLAALVLILFLFAALPLGFFEFGGMVLSGIVQKYVQVVVYSLGLTLLMRVSAEMLRTILPEGLSTVGAVVEWVMLVGALVFATRSVAGATLTTLTSSLTVFPQTVRAGLGIPEREGPSALQTAARVTTGALTGVAAFGGNALGAVIGAAAALGGGMALIPGGRRASPGRERGGESSFDALEPGPQVGDVFMGNGSVPREENLQPVPERYPSWGGDRRDKISTPGWSDRRGADAVPVPGVQMGDMWGGVLEEGEKGEETFEIPVRDWTGEEKRPVMEKISPEKVVTHSTELNIAMRQAQILGSGLQPSQGKNEQTEEKG